LNYIYNRNSVPFVCFDQDSNLHLNITFLMWKYTSGFGWFCYWKSEFSFPVHMFVHPQQSVSGSGELGGTTKYRTLEYGEVMMIKIDV